MSSTKSASVIHLFVTSVHAEVALCRCIHENVDSKTISHEGHQCGDENGQGMSTAMSAGAATRSVYDFYLGCLKKIRKSCFPTIECSMSPDSTVKEFIFVLLSNHFQYFLIFALLML